MIKKYQAHVDLLAWRMGCQLVQRPKIPGMMYVELGYVEGPTITNQIEYLTMLHELGHFAWGHTQGRPPHSTRRFYFDNGVLHSEAQAWEWALDRCIDPIQDASRRFMWDTCLGSYYYMGYICTQGRPTRLGNGDRHYVEFVYDHPNEYFERIMCRIQGDLTGFVIQYTGRHNENLA